MGVSRCCQGNGRAHLNPLRGGKGGFINTYYEWAELKCFRKRFLASRCINWLDQNAEDRRRQQRWRLQGSYCLAYGSYSSRVSEKIQITERWKPNITAIGFLQQRCIFLYIWIQNAGQKKIRLRSSNLWTNNRTVRKCVLVKDAKTQVQSNATAAQLTKRSRQNMRQPERIKRTEKKLHIHVYTPAHVYAQWWLWGEHPS